MSSDVLKTWQNALNRNKYGLWRALAIEGMCRKQSKSAHTALLHGLIKNLNTVVACVACTGAIQQLPIAFYRADDQIGVVI